MKLNPTPAALFKPQIRKYDRALQRAFLYSLIFHGLVFGLFRIKFLDVHESDIPLRPINVAIEKEEHGTVAINTEEATSFGFIENEPTPTYGPVTTAPFYALALQTTASSTSLEELFDNEYMQKVAFEKTYSEKIYPLTLQCSKSLTKLKLLQDGSELFHQRAAHESSASFLLATQHYPISYEVYVSPKTGKVVRWTRKRELLDKPLQQLADRIIEKIAFQPFEKRAVTVEEKEKSKEKKGKISIVFHAPYDIVEGFLIQ